jgi:UDP-3-O-[3-hydroxymyristoyl] N-acetylglucosamine deacetylase
MKTAPWRRKTVGHSVSLSGPSLATGDSITVTVRPAEAGTGIVFRHLPTGTDIPADLAHVRDVPQCTSLAAGGASIDFVEHLMAALWAERITDATVEVSGGEVPLLDGSAQPYVVLLRDAGAAELQGQVEATALQGRAFYETGERRAILALPGRGFGYLLDHDHPLIGRQYCHFDSADGDFVRDLAPARTFATEQETRALLAARDLQGARPEMAIIAHDDHLSEPEPFPDSFAAHKVVDMIGDLYLLGRPLDMKVIGCRTGHTDNRALARQIAEAFDLPFVAQRTGAATATDTR